MKRYLVIFKDGKKVLTGKQSQRPKMEKDWQDIIEVEDKDDLEVEDLNVDEDAKQVTIDEDAKAKRVKEKKAREEQELAEELNHVQQKRQALRELKELAAEDEPDTPVGENIKGRDVVLKLRQLDRKVNMIIRQLKKVL